MISPVFPFTAIVGQEKMRLALVLNAVTPQVGGVLIRGEKGTAKSTLARALADLLPPIAVVPGCPFQCDPDDPFPECPHCAPLLAQGPLPRTMRPIRVVNLPVNASEDRVCGTLDLEKTLKTGQKHFEPGLLAEVHRGILYIDEVNLLDDHIVDVLLDAAAMGVNTVEREGVRMTHPSRFILIGTMNPEEGDLRPQLLDRFGLCVEVSAILDVEARAEIVRRRLEWEADPQAFAARFAPQQVALTESILAARQRLPLVRIEEGVLRQISELCVRLDVHSHRADITIAHAARALAALEGRLSVTSADVQRAAELALPHRMRRRPFEEVRLDSEQIAQILQESLLETIPPPPPSLSERPSEGPSSEAPSERVSPPGSSIQPEAEHIFDIREVPAVPLRVPKRRRVASGSEGRRTPEGGRTQRGRSVRSRAPQGPVASGDVALEATLRAAAPHQAERSPSSLAIQVQPTDLRIKVREHPVHLTLIFVVDASGSMGARQRMAAAKGAILNLLKDAYTHRCRVALIAFRKNSAEILLQPTDSVENALLALKKLPTGGETPLSHGLMKAWELLMQLHHRDPASQPMVVLVSDGRANVFYQPGSAETPFAEAVALACQLTDSGARLLVVDTEDDFLNLGLARELAESAGADYVKLAAVEAVAIERAVREKLF
ncbi:MAG: magnesium chelatase subunit D family protein [Anaerolineae bacterium]|nr:magnesium chelatase subunit D family protein [Anaerolineae bacterium]MDW8069671.1 magnesium chelatase subunit D family protein [Anaerolineae bacterium]